MAATTMKASPDRVSAITKSLRYEHLVAGVSGGVASTLILHPLDLIKIRFAGEISLIYTLSMIIINDFVYCSERRAIECEAAVHGTFPRSFQHYTYRGIQGTVPRSGAQSLGRWLRLGILFFLVIF